MEIAHNIVDLWGVLGGVAGLLAFLGWIIGYLFPLSDQNALRRGRRGFLLFFIAAEISVGWSRGWLQVEIHLSLWEVLVISMALLGLTYIVARPRKPVHPPPLEEKFTFEVSKEGDGLEFRLVDGEAQLPPFCKKHRMPMYSSPLASYQERWTCREHECPLHRVPFVWDALSRGPLVEEVEARMIAWRHNSK